MVRHTKFPNVFSVKNLASVPSVKPIFIFNIQEAQPDHQAKKFQTQH